VGSWILENFATVEEVKRNIGQLRKLHNGERSARVSWQSHPDGLRPRHRDARDAGRFNSAVAIRPRLAYNTSVLPFRTGDEAVLQAFHILNNFDIPRGSAREDRKDAHGNVIADYTLWTSASELKARRFYFRTRENSQFRPIDLIKMPLDAKSIATVSMKGPKVIKSLNP
jgi:penicillin V acylase-like amidase (Ntn superfamily)